MGGNPRKRRRVRRFGISRFGDGAVYDDYLPRPCAAQILAQYTGLYRKEHRGAAYRFRTGGLDYRHVQHSAPAENPGAEKRSGVLASLKRDNPSGADANNRRYYLLYAGTHESPCRTARRKRIGKRRAFGHDGGMHIRRYRCGNLLRRGAPANGRQLRTSAAHRSAIDLKKLFRIFTILSYKSFMGGKFKTTWLQRIRMMNRK